MGKIVHRIDAPGILGSVVRGMQNAIHHRIPHVQIARRHVDLGPQRATPIGKFPLPHPRKEIHILLHGSITERTLFARGCEGSAIFTNLVER